MNAPYPQYNLNGPNGPNDPYNNRNSSQANQAQNALGMAAQMSRARTNNFNDYNRDMETMNNPAYIANDGKNYGGDLYADSRGGFVRKVYTLLSIQLIITALICLIAMKSQTFRNIFGNAVAVIILSVLLLVFSIAIGCCAETFRKYGLPILIVFTVIFALLVGVICSMTKPEIVLAATGITALIVVGLTIYACVTKTDLTGCGPYLFVLLLVLLVFGIVCIFWKNPIVHLVYACLAALLYSVYLVFDTQLVLGKFQNSYSLDDAYFAALQLYIDIIQIFLQVLRILSYANSN